MIPDTPSSAASGMGEYELASASVRPEPGSVETMAPLVTELRALADCDSRAGEPLGKCMRKAADKIERLAEHVDYIEAQWLAKADALSAKDRELAEARSENESHKTALLIALQEAEAWRAEAELEADKRAAAERNSADSIVAPAECGPNCDDPECPYSHQPLTLRQAYENAIHRMRAAERARDEALSALREMKEALRTCHRFLSNQTPNNDALLDMIDAVLARGGK